jgi:nitrate reductase alpha subunit
MAERGIEDGDQVRVYNDLAEVEVQAKSYPSSERGTARHFFSWEKFQYPDRDNFNSLVPMYMKPTQLVQYPEDTGEHLHFFPNYWGPTGVNSDVRVEIERVEAGPGEPQRDPEADDGGGSSGDTDGDAGGDGS